MGYVCVQLLSKRSCFSTIDQLGDKVPMEYTRQDSRIMFYFFHLSVLKIKPHVHEKIFCDKFSSQIIWPCVRVSTFILTKYPWISAVSGFCTEERRAVKEGKPPKSCKKVREKIHPKINGSFLR